MISSGFGIQNLYYMHNELDDDALIFIIEYYEALRSNRSKLESAYSENAHLTVQFKDQPPRLYSKDFHKIPPNGIRKIIHATSMPCGKQNFVHVLSDLIQPNSTTRVDECFLLTISDFSILITYQSIHINPFLDVIHPLQPPPPPKPSPVIKKPEPTPVRDPEEVDSPSKLHSISSIFANNINFNYPPKDFLPMLQKFGNIVRYTQVKGKLCAEFENRNDAKKASSQRDIEWNGRTVHIRMMPKDFSFS